MVCCNNNNKKSIINNTEVGKLVVNWDKAHNSKDVKVFSELFDNYVLFYGTRLDKNSCIESKLSFFKKHPDFYEQIFGDIQIENQNDNSIKCSFIKRVTLNQMTKDYPSYLTFKKVDNDWKIIIEGDLVTDKNLAKRKENDISIPKNAVKGDFNGDGISEYVWLVKPKFLKKHSEESIGECDGNCECYLKFSDNNIPSIKIENCIGGFPVNEGDLNDDGADEIGILPDWWTSCWRDYEVFTFRNGNWKYLVEPFPTHCNQWDNGTKAIVKDLNKSGYVIIKYSVHTGTDIITKTKSLKAER